MTYGSIAKKGVLITLLGVAPILVGVFAAPVEANSLSKKRSTAGQNLAASLASERLPENSDKLTGTSGTGANKGTIRRRCGPGGKYTCTLQTR